MTAPDESARFLTDPIGVITEIVGRVEPDLESAVIAAAVEDVARSRSGRRRLAKALEDNPSLLTSGRTEGPPLIDRLIRVLRQRGAITVVQPCCAACGKTPQQICRHGDNGLRICTSCHNRNKGVRAPAPCAICRRVLIPRDYDRQGRPRCGQCPPDPGVDHVEVICDLITALDPKANRERLRELTVGTVRQEARRRQVAWEFEDRPELLTGAAAQGSHMVRRLVTLLAEHGVAGVVAPRCPFCGKTRPITALREATPCCQTCYQKARATACVRCGLVQPISTRTPEGQPLCFHCARREPYNKQTCSVCGQWATIASHRSGAPVCVGCWQMPSAVCSVCGKFKPCRHVDTAVPRCANCYHRSRTAQCARCDRMRPIGGRDANGNSLCGGCAQRREACCRCERVRPVSGRVDDGPLCWTCIKTEPAYFRACTDCGTVARLRHCGLCDRCAVPTLLDAALAGPDGTVRAEVEPVRHALAASNPVTVLNWLQRPSTRTLLGRLATGTGPVTHKTLDDLEPAGPARHLRQVLIAQQVLPDRDRHLESLQRWSDTTLASVDDLDAQRMLRGYLNWTHLRRLRRRGAPTTPYATASIRNEITSAINLLNWLHTRGRNLRTCTQADLDPWCMLGGRPPRRARRFIAWCAERGVTGPLTIPAPPESTRHVVFADEETRWRIARRLLHDDAVATADRVAGLLVLLYGQTVARIVRLTTDNVTQADGHVHLLLGRQPLTVPSPLDHLLLALVDTRRGKAALGHTDNHHWLFPGGLPGQALHPLPLTKRLRELGIPSRIGRNTALIDNAATLPAKVLSDLLGLSITGAVRWTRLAGSSGNAYAAEVARRASTTDTRT